jgi:hypothetical protein
MGKRGLKGLIETLTGMKCQAASNAKCKTVRTDVVALSVASLVFGTCRSGGESMIVCVAYLEVSR